MVDQKLMLDLSVHRKFALERKLLQNGHIQLIISSLPQSFGEAPQLDGSEPIQVRLKR